MEREFDFESNADVHLISDLRTTYGNCTNNDVKKAFSSLLNIYEHKIEEISAGKLTLSDNWLKILSKVKDY